MAKTIIYTVNAKGNIILEVMRDYLQLGSGLGFAVVSEQLGHTSAAFA